MAENKAPARVLHPNDLFALRYVHDARLSPDGRLIAFVTSRTDEEKSEEFFTITIRRLDTGEHQELGFPGRATFPRWSPDGTRLAFIGALGGSQRLYVTDTSLTKSNPLTPENAMVQGPPAWSPDGSSIAITYITVQPLDAMRRVTKRIFRSEGIGTVDNLTMSIHIADIRSGNVRPLDTQIGNALQPEFSPQGDRILFLGADSAVGFPGMGGLYLYAMEISTGRVRQLLGEGWFIAAAAWAPSGDKIVVAGDFESPVTVPTVGLWVINRDGSDPQCRTDGFVGNVGLRVHHDMPTWTTSQNNVLAVPHPDFAYATVTTHGSTEIWKVALEGANTCEPVVDGQRSCIVLDANLQESQLVFCASDLFSPWELYLKDLATDEEHRLTRLNDDVLAKWPALRMDHLKYNSADDLALEGWNLTRADLKGPQPTVMFIHGGPFLSTGYVFRFDFHLLAANGYAVLFTNFRGSGGYGEPFARAIMNDWGSRGFPDHMAAADAVIDAGLADPERMGVWGPSHGGFATCWIVGHTSRFKAAVAESSVSNFTSLYYLTDAPDVFTSDLGGLPHEIPDVYRSRSPITYAHNSTTPTLMLHGQDDLRCPVAEAEQFYRALHDAGCKTELVVIEGMNHMGDSVGPLSARRIQNEAVLDWFERFL